VLTGTQLTTEHEPVVTRHHDIEHDKIDRVTFEKAAHLAAIGGD